MLLGLTRDLALHVYTMAKYYCRAPRPIDFTMKVQPMIQTPEHSSYPSGHATEAFALATVMHRLATGESAAAALKKSPGPMLFRIAHRIAANRTVAGVHFPVDSASGAWVGCHIGELVYAFASGQPFQTAPGPDLTVPDRNGHTKDFLLSTFDFSQTGIPVTPVALGVVRELWTRAAEEWPGAPAALPAALTAGGQQ